MVEGGRGAPPNLANRVGPKVLAILCENFMTHTAHTHERSRVELLQKGRDPMTEQQKSEEQKIAVLKDIADTLKNIRSELREIRVAVIGLRTMSRG